MNNVKCFFFSNAVVKSWAVLKARKQFLSFAIFKKKKADLNLRYSV